MIPSEGRKVFRGHLTGLATKTNYINQMMTRSEDNEPLQMCFYGGAFG